MIIVVIILAAAFFFIGRYFWNTAYFPFRVKKLYEAYERGEYENVLNTINTFSEAQRKEVDVQWLLAKVYYEQTQYVMAMVHLNDILDGGAFTKEISPIEIHKMLAHIYEKTNKFKKAMEEYEEIVKLDEANFEALYKLGVSAFQRQDYTSAKLYFEKASILNDAQPDIAYMLAYIYYEEKAFAKSFENVQKALTLDPNNHKATLLRGKIFLNQKDMESAKEDLLVAYNISECKMEAAEYLGRISYEEKDYENAAKYFDNGLTLSTKTDDETMYSRYLYADVLVKQKKYNDALTQWRIIKNAKKTMLDVEDKITAYSTILANATFQQMLSIDLEEYVDNILYKVFAKNGYAITETHKVLPTLIYCFTNKKIGGGTQSYSSAFAIDSSCEQVRQESVIDFLAEIRERNVNNCFYISLGGFSSIIKPGDFSFPVEFVDAEKFEAMVNGNKNF